MRKDKKPDDNEQMGTVIGLSESSIDTTYGKQSTVDVVIRVRRMDFKSLRLSEVVYVRSGLK